MTNGQLLHKLILTVLKTHDLSTYQKADVSSADGSYEPEDYEQAVEEVVTISDNTTEMIRLLKKLPKPPIEMPNYLVVVIDTTKVNDRLMKKFRSKKTSRTDILEGNYMVCKLSPREYLSLCGGPVSRQPFVVKVKPVFTIDTEFDKLWFEYNRHIKRHGNTITTKQVHADYNKHIVENVQPLDIITQHILDMGWLSISHLNNTDSDTVDTLDYYKEISDYMTEVFKGDKDKFNEYWTKTWRRSENA